MRLAKFVLPALTFLAVTAFAQANPRSNEKIPQPFALLSYSRGYAVDWTPDENLLSACLAVYDGGYYRMLRRTTRGLDRTQGRLSRGELESLRAALKKINTEGEEPGGLVKEGAESFAAQILRNNRLEQHHWLDPDHQKPFPQPVVDLVTWLQKLTPKDSMPLVGNEAICPLSAMPIRPTTAELFLR